MVFIKRDNVSFGNYVLQEEVPESIFYESL